MEKIIGEIELRKSGNGVQIAITELRSLEQAANRVRQVNAGVASSAAVTQREFRGMAGAMKSVALSAGFEFAPRVALLATSLHQAGDAAAGMMKRLIPIVAVAGLAEYALSRMAGSAEAKASALAKYGDSLDALQTKLGSLSRAPGLERDLFNAQRSAAAQSSQLNQFGTQSGVDVSAGLGLVRQIEGLEIAEAKLKDLGARTNALNQVVAISQQADLDRLEGFERQKLEIEIKFQRSKDALLEQSLKLRTDEEKRAYELARKNILALRDLEMDRLEQTRKGYQDLLTQGVQSFSAGAASALIDAFEEGDQAFQKFAANFLRLIAQMILQQLIFNAVQAGLKAVGAAGAANGIVRFAANGINTVSQPTLFPRHNVIAGEAGPEMFTVLARPRLMRFGGVQGVVGDAGPNRLAVLPAAQAGAALAGGGAVEIRVRLEAGLRADIVNQSVRDARVAVLHDMRRDGDLSRATRDLR